MLNQRFDKNLTRHVPGEFSFGSLIGKFLLSVLSIISLYAFVVYVIDSKAQNEIPEIIEIIPPPGDLPREHIEYVEFKWDCNCEWIASIERHTHYDVNWGMDAPGFKPLTATKILEIFI